MAKFAMLADIRLHSIFLQYGSEVGSWTAIFLRNFHLRRRNYCIGRSPCFYYPFFKRRDERILVAAPYGYSVSPLYRLCKRLRHLLEYLFLAILFHDRVITCIFKMVGSGYGSSLVLCCPVFSCIPALCVNIVICWAGLKNIDECRTFVGYTLFDQLL